MTTLVVVFFLYTFGSRPLFPSSLFLLGDKLKMKRDERHLPVDAFGKANNGHKLYSDWYGKISIRSYNNQQMTIKFYMTLHCVRRLHQSGAQLENCLIFVQPPLLHSLKYGTESIEKSSRFRRCRRCRYGDMGHGRSGRRLARRSAVLLPRHGSHSRRFPVPASGDLSLRHHF